MDPIAILIDHYETQCLALAPPGATNALLCPHVEVLRGETNNLDQTTPDPKSDEDGIFKRCEFDKDALADMLSNYIDRRQSYYIGIANEIKGMSDFLDRDPINLSELISHYKAGTLTACDWWLQDWTKAAIALLYMLKIEGTALIEAARNISFSNIGSLVLSILLKFINIDLSLLTNAFFIITSPAKCITSLLVECADNILASSDFFLGKGGMFALPDGTQVATGAQGEAKEGIADAEKVIGQLRGAMRDLDRTVDDGIAEMSKKINSLLDEWDAIAGQMKKMREKSIKAFADIERIQRLCCFVQVLSGGSGEDDPPQERFTMPDSVKSRLGDFSGTTETQTIS